MSVKKRNKSSLFSVPELSTLISDAITCDFSADVPDVIGVEAASFYRKAQLSSTLKKLEVDGDKTSLEAKAFELFKRLNVEIHDVNRDLNRCLDPDRSKLGAVLAVARHIVEAMVGTVLTAEEIFLSSKHGGGVTVGTKYADCGPEAKWEFPISCTEVVKPALERYLGWDYQLSASLPNVADNAMRFHIVPGSRATTVPKNVEKRRMIAIEPTGNMFLQQGLMDILYGRLKKFGLDVTILPKYHTTEAWRSSIHGLNATIDFSSASDTIPVNLVELLFPPVWSSWLLCTRSPEMEVGGERIDLSMFATMGNATTFPVELIVFYSLALACHIYRKESLNGIFYWSLVRYRLDRLIRQYGTSCSVFGDDTILPVADVQSFNSICALLGMQVNHDKSFSSGPFRESCGGDYYKGVLVRPFFLRAPSGSDRTALESWLYTVLNGAIQSYLNCFGPLTYLYEKRLFAVLSGLFKRFNLKVKVVPDDFPSDSGLTTRDWRRLVYHYRFPLNPVTLDEHDSFTGEALIFRYLVPKTPANACLRLYDALKRGPVRLGAVNWEELSRSETALLFRRNDAASRSLDLEWLRKRKKGRYVVTTVFGYSRQYLAG